MVNDDLLERYTQSIAASERAYRSSETIDDALTTPWALHYEVNRGPATPNYRTDPKESTSNTTDYVLFSFAFEWTRVTASTSCRRNRKLSIPSEPTRYPFRQSLDMQVSRLRRVVFSLFIYSSSMLLEMMCPRQGTSLSIGKENKA